MTRSRPFARPSRAFGFAKFLSLFPKQLKSITDGAYDAMMDAIRRDELPSMYFMQYEIVPPPPGLLPRGGEGVRRTVEGEWVVRNLLLVPHFAFPPSAIIKRKPLFIGVAVSYSM